MPAKFTRGKIDVTRKLNSHSLQTKKKKKKKKKIQTLKKTLTTSLRQDLWKNSCQ